MKTGTSDTYIIKGGQVGADRLKILAEVMWPYTYPFLLKAGLKEGMKCLDVGCGNGELTKRIAAVIGYTGHITGIDFDPTVIQIAENTGDNHNVHFQVLNIETEELPDASFDFIFCRFILSHLQQPKIALKKLHNALNPGGIIAIEDVDFDGHFSFPPSTAFNTYVKWYEEIGKRKGGNPLIGPSLLHLITGMGLEDIQFNVELPTFYQGDGKRMALLTLQAIQDTIITEQIATPEEVDQVLDDLNDYTTDDKSIMSLPRIFQVSGRKHVILM